MVIDEFESATNGHQLRWGLGGLALLFSNVSLVFMGLAATMIRIYGAIRMPNAYTKP